MSFRRRFIAIVKFAWLLLVFGGVVLYVASNFDHVISQLGLISPVRMVLACGALIIARLLLVELSRRSVNLVGQSICFERMFYINSLSQLAKYLPGGIWHFVGRAVYYHADGLTVKQTTQAMIVENVWLVTSACCVGAIFIILYAADAANLLALLALAVLWMSIQVVIIRMHTTAINWQDVAALFVLQGITWVLLGASLWFLIPAAGELEVFTLVVGAFCVSWAIGYLTIFAPSGLGVREGLVIALLALAIAPAAALVYVTVHRLAWVTVELTLGLIARLVASRQLAVPESSG